MGNAAVFLDRTLIARRDFAKAQPMNNSVRATLMLITFIYSHGFSQLPDTLTCTVKKELSADEYKSYKANWPKDAGSAPTTKSLMSEIHGEPQGPLGESPGAKVRIKGKHADSATLTPTKLEYELEGGRAALGIEILSMSSKTPTCLYLCTKVYEWDDAFTMLPKDENEIKRQKELKRPSLVDFDAQLCEGSNLVLKHPPFFGGAEDVFLVCK